MPEFVTYGPGGFNPGVPGGNVASRRSYRPPLDAPGGSPPAAADPVIYDDFRGTRLDPSRWATVFPYGDPNSGCVHSSCPNVLFRTQNVSVQDGYCRLTGERLASPVVFQGVPRDYASGMISTGHTHDWVNPTPEARRWFYQGSRITAEVRFTEGKGVWPAMWLLPKHPDWPPEIDVMEVTSKDYSRLWMKVHWKKQDGSNGDSGDTWSSPSSLAGDWHEYGLDWFPDRLAWSVDGVVRQVVNFPTAAVTAQFRRGFYLIFNLQLGSNDPNGWNPSPDETTPFPVFMDVRNVRVVAL